MQIDKCRWRGFPENQVTDSRQRNIDTTVVNLKRHSSSSETVCFALSTPKRAALFYDRVVWVPHPSDVVQPLPDLMDSDFRRVDMLPSSFSSGYYDNVTSIWRLLRTVIMQMRQDGSDFETTRERILGYVSHVLDENRNLGIEQASLQYLKSRLPEAETMYRILTLGSLASMEPYDSEFEDLGNIDLVTLLTHGDSAGESGHQDGPMVQIANIPLVDDRHLDWRQVIQFREDAESRTRLGRLQRFARHEFAGKSHEEIEDRLTSCIEDHKAAAEKHGINTVETALTVGGGSGGVASLIVAVAGAAIPIAAAIGASLGLGTALVRVVAARKTFEIDQTMDPVRYIIDVQEATESNK